MTDAWPAEGDRVLVRRYSLLGRLVHEHDGIVERRTPSTVRLAQGSGRFVQHGGAWVLRPRYLDYTTRLEPIGEKP